MDADGRERSTETPDDDDDHDDHGFADVFGSAGRRHCRRPTWAFTSGFSDQLSALSFQLSALSRQPDAIRASRSLSRFLSVWLTAES
jgi:hypothetical protein